MSKLRDIQQSFQRSLRYQDNSIVNDIVKPPDMEAADRLQVYYNDYYFRLRDVLKENYGMLYKRLADDQFDTLVQGYLEHYPSRTYTIHEVGYQFPIYLAEYYDNESLIELARFECEMMRVLYAADAEVLDIDALAALDPEAWDSLQLHLHPSLRQLLCAYNTLERWLALDDDQDIASSKLDTPITVIVWRYEHQAFFRALTPEELILLDEIKKGHVFSVLCEKMLGYFDETHVVEWVAGVLQAWITEGIFTV